MQRATRILPPQPHWKMWRAPRMRASIARSSQRDASRRIVSAGPGTVDVELGGLARTDNSGWGDEFEKLTERLIEDKR